MLSLASHNVGTSWDELNPDDPKEGVSEDDTRCDSGPMWMKILNEGDLEMNKWCGRGTRVVCGEIFLVNRRFV